ncbi:ubiquinol oxidase subunit II [Roseomonas sp. KE0001]|uniref:ubiquinol oxidase subunit II n=1 Tax=unclassified Roseomonas TaxID=2617492 RepID=UPI0018E02DC5|nr:ubiquinol oxidase subunit II [Roseomonas sp. KE0001]MBI0434479.1 ubiquinol oxidase subunit II [Roseomonas sp. KE0001]
MRHKISRLLVLVPLAALLAGCNLVVMNPSGDIAVQQRDLIVASTVLMLLIIVPVILLTLFFAWRYRESNTKATYAPNWSHSTTLEVVIWAAPLVIIVALGALTWVGTHLLDPYRPLDRLDAERPIPQGTRTLEVEVVSLDWKWLFIYPQQGIATVNELAAPVDTPIAFRITSASVMNAFAIPAMAGMIYSMPGMETKLHAVINREGVYDGFSANYSGGGFSQMRFKFHGLSQDGFDRWVEQARAEQGTRLDRSAYLELEKPSEREPVRRYGEVDPEIFSLVVNRCVDPDKMCMSDMMAIDARGGLGIAGGALNIARGKAPAAPGRGQSRPYVPALCNPDDPFGTLQLASIRAEPPKPAVN